MCQKVKWFSLVPRIRMIFLLGFISLNFIVFLILFFFFALSTIIMRSHKTTNIRIIFKPQKILCNIVIVTYCDISHFHRLCYPWVHSSQPTRHIHISTISALYVSISLFLTRTKRAKYVQSLFTVRLAEDITHNI